MVQLKDLGHRICIIGPSSGGKSTLALALSKKLNIEVCHLDQLAHIPYTDWQPRDRKLLEADHNLFLELHKTWIIEGNYSFLMPERFARATSVIWLDFDLWGSLRRYIWRSFQGVDARPGNLEGATQQFSWEHLHYMTFLAPQKRANYQNLLQKSDVTTLRLHSFQELKKYYAFWDLQES